jgi:hypothetical protein
MGSSRACKYKTRVKKLTLKSTCARLSFTFYPLKRFLFRGLVQTKKLFSRIVFEENFDLKKKNSNFRLETKSS